MFELADRICALAKYASRGYQEQDDTSEQDDRSDQELRNQELRNRELRSGLREKELEVFQLKQELRAAKHRIATDRQTKAEIDETIDRLNTEAARLEAVSSKLLQGTLLENAKLKVHLDAAREELRMTEECIEEVLAAGVEEVREKVLAEMAKQKEKEEEARGQAGGAGPCNDVVRRRLEEETVRAEAMEKEKANLEARLAELTENNERTKTELFELRRNKEIAEKGHVDGKAQVAKLKKELEQGRRRKEGLEQEVAIAKKEAKDSKLQLKAQKDATKKSVSLLSEQKESVDSEVAREKKQISNLQADLAETKRRKEKSSKTVQALREEKRRIDAEVAEEEKEEGKLIAEIKHRKQIRASELQKSRHELNMCNMELSIVETAIRTLKSQVEEVREEKAELMMLAKEIRTARVVERNGVEMQESDLVRELEQQADVVPKEAKGNKEGMGTGAKVIVTTAPVAKLQCSPKKRSNLPVKAVRGRKDASSRVIVVEAAEIRKLSWNSNKVQSDQAKSKNTVKVLRGHKTYAKEEISTEKTLGTAAIESLGRCESGQGNLIQIFRKEKTCLSDGASDIFTRKSKDTQGLEQEARLVEIGGNTERLTPNSKKEKSKKTFKILPECSRLIGRH